MQGYEENFCLDESYCIHVCMYATDELLLDNFNIFQNHCNSTK